MIRRIVADTPEQAEQAEQALRLAELGIAVVPGAYPTADGRCSCGDRGCRTSAAHPADSGWLFHATTDPDTVARWWRECPQAGIIVPLLGGFHVVEVAPGMAQEALHWLPEHYVGPVAITPSGRYQFWAAPGAEVELAVLLGRKGCSLCDVDLRVLREGTYVLAPPSSLGAAGAYRWVRPPLTRIRDLPESGALLHRLCDVCDRVALRRPVRAGRVAS
ncbi:MAG: bifunctional DNA primase/polymerase [Streptosporangiaceae bacterium]